MVDTAAPWEKSWRADPYGRAIADRHYSRGKVGATQFVKPGACLVLTATGALWVSSWPLAEYVKHAWAGAWECATFRNERRDLWLSSDLITAAIAATRWHWPEVPDLGMVTMVDEDETRRGRSRRSLPGECFRHAGFVEVGRTKVENLVVLQLLPDAMPEPAPALGSQLAMAL